MTRTIIQDQNETRVIHSIADTTPIRAYASAFDPTLWQTVLAELRTTDALAATAFATLSGETYIDDRVTRLVTITRPARDVERLLIRPRGNTLQIYTVKAHANARVWTPATDALLSAEQWALFKRAMGVANDADGFAALADAHQVGNVADLRDDEATI